VADKEQVVRCAIYTRKSTEEGLEQEFNSLQAQRESAEAYILSQRQAGWIALPRHYDDGGFSGASLERPALKKLLADVEARRIDCVLVYKVDRLSRSLLDFSRLVELFDRCGVSFVSVTQEFNTTSSLGRLTLNILLSFAQFEREIIGERTRDKLGAARRKGKWIGGSPVLGYDVDPQGGRLVLNQAEAGQVRAIFQIAAEGGSLEQTLKQVHARGFQTKQWTSKGGTYRPGKRFSRNTLRLLLGNVLYTGSVSHKGVVYPGEQARVVEEELWEKVNHRLAIRSAQQRRRPHHKQHGLVGDLLYCGHCHGSMVLTQIARAGQRYEYYICPLARKSKGIACQQKPVAAMDLDSSLSYHLEPTLGCELSAPIMQQALERVMYDCSTRRVAVMRRDGTRSEYTLVEPMRRGCRSAKAENTGRIPRISRLMALAIKMERLVGEGTVASYRDLAEVGHVSRPRLSQILRLTELAPAIQEELLFLPKTLAGRDCLHESALRDVARLMDWELQVKQFRSLMSSAEQARF
jgi:DNA invertase Pin-like site-specific DNA recombinase